MYTLNFSVQIGFRDLGRFHDGFGSQMVLFIYNLTQFIGGFTLGFIFSWKLILAALAACPLLIVVASVVNKVRSEGKGMVLL